MAAGQIYIHVLCSTFLSVSFIKSQIPAQSESMRNRSSAGEWISAHPVFYYNIQVSTIRLLHHISPILSSFLSNNFQMNQKNHHLSFNQFLFRLCSKWNWSLFITIEQFEWNVFASLLASLSTKCLPYNKSFGTLAFRHTWTAATICTHTGCQGVNQKGYQRLRYRVWKEL